MKKLILSIVALMVLAAMPVGAQDKKAKTQFSNRVKILLEATNKHNFIKGLTEIVADAENKDNIKEIASVINAMPSDNVPYFLTLIRFHYASINNVK